jgi:hypothetical protein
MGISKLECLLTLPEWSMLRYGAVLQGEAPVLPYTQILD